MSSTRSRRKRVAKANAQLIDRLRQIPARPIDPTLLKVIADRSPLSARDAIVIDKQVRDLVAEVQRVEQIRIDLAQVASLPFGGSVLL